MLLVLFHVFLLVLFSWVSMVICIHLLLWYFCMHYFLACDSLVFFQCVSLVMSLNVIECDLFSCILFIYCLWFFGVSLAMSFYVILWYLFSCVILVLVCL